MYCSSCGNKLGENANFCDKCGIPVNDTSMEFQRKPESMRASDMSIEERASYSKAEHLSGNWAETGAAALHEFSGNVMNAADNLGLDPWQKAVGGIALCTAFFFLICITGSLTSWITAVSGIMLTVFCLQKKRFDSIELLLAMSVFILRFVVVDIETLFDRLGGGYVYYHAFAILMRIVMYSLIVIYWMAITGGIRRKESAFSLVFVLSAVTAVYALVNFLTAFPNGFRSVLFYLGWAGFFTCYIIQMIRNQDIMRYIKSVTGSQGTGRHPFLNQTYSSAEPTKPAESVTPVTTMPPESENRLESSVQPVQEMPPESEVKPEPGESFIPEAQSEIEIQSEPAEPTISEAQTSSENNGNIRRVLFCLSCGSRLPSDSVFCEHCGMPVQVDNNGDGTAKNS